MTKLKSIYEMLQPNIKSELKASARKYDSAKRLKYKLMGTTLWHDLSLSDISSLTSYCGLFSHELTASDIMYGSSKFLIK